MYPFGQARNGLVWALALLPVLNVLHKGAFKIAAASPTERMVVEAQVLSPQVFSPQWVEGFAEEELGCGQGRASYMWRKCGFGSNINNLINAWVYAIVVEGWSDVAVLVDSEQLQDLKCSEESGGLESQGFGCLFSNMPHLCVFNSVKEWKNHTDSAGVSAEDKQKVEKIASSLSVVRSANITESFEELNVDQRGAKAVMTTFMWRHMTPWVRRDIGVVTHIRDTFQTSPFIGIHVRRGDKLYTGTKYSNMRHSVESYIVEAVRALERDPHGTSVDAIKGIWVASDDKNVVDEVRESARAYFPNVHFEDIVYVAGGVPGGVQIEAVTTHSNTQGYGASVYLLADLQQLVTADVFVGSCSSNIGRLVMVLRDGLGKDKSSAISLDIPWTPTRQRGLVLD